MLVFSRGPPDVCLHGFYGYRFFEVQGRPPYITKRRGVVFLPKCVFLGW